jgi:hypothetical protein
MLDIYIPLDTTLKFPIDILNGIWIPNIPIFNGLLKFLETVRHPIESIIFTIVFYSPLKS